MLGRQIRRACFARTDVFGEPLGEALLRSLNSLDLHRRAIRQMHAIGKFDRIVLDCGGDTHARKLPQTAPGVNETGGA